MRAVFVTMIVLSVAWACLELFAKDKIDRIEKVIVSGIREKFRVRPCERGAKRDRAEGVDVQSASDSSRVCSSRNGC